jgi:anti-sigma factor ChrR (cupin superfamily)
MSQSPTSLYVTTADRPWVERRPGIVWRVLWEDGDRRAVLMRYAPGASIPRHRHLGEEHVYVLEGSIADDAGTCTTGNFVHRPPGCVHAVTSYEGALVLAVMSGGTEPC